jgi:extradiol dioxygenase family protein
MPSDIQETPVTLIPFHIAFGEQATISLLEPAGNALEFKAFADIGQLFAK